MDVNTASKNLLFTTVKITATTAAGVGTGTGFIMDIEDSEDSSVPVVVTNKHVVEGALQISIRMIGARQDEDQPQLGTAHDFPLDQTSTKIVGHPDAAVDIAVFPLIPVIKDRASEVFFRRIPRKLMPTPDEGAKHDALEEVTFVGYPNGWSDEVHHTPIVRRGITATPMMLKYGGNPVYLVDGSVFGGSSGSPVFLFNQGSYPDGAGNVVLGSRLQLVGIMAATMVRHSHLPVAVSAQPHVKVAQEMNLGVAFNWMAIEETIQHLEKLYGLGSGDQAATDTAKPE